MRLPRTGIAATDRALIEVTQILKDQAKQAVCLTSYAGTKSAGYDHPLIRVKEPMTLESVFFDVDTTIVSDATNFWTFQVAIYRPGYTVVFKAVPTGHYNDGTESVTTKRFALVAHTGLLVTFDTELKAGDVVVLEVTKNSAASDLVDFFVQTDLTRAS